MNYGKALAIAMIVLSLASSLGYFMARDYRRGIYWLCSAGIVASVTL